MSVVYFLRPIGMIGPIKIGCSKQVEYRMDVLATWSPFPLDLITTIDGGIYLERNIHECFANLHSHKEWFHPGKRLLEFIEKLKNGVPAHEAIDLSKRVAPIVSIARKKPCRPGHEGLRSYRMKLRLASEKASKVCGKRMLVPKDAMAIIDRWSGFVGYGQPVVVQRPSEAEFDRLNQIIAAPTVYCVSYKEFSSTPSLNHTGEAA